jgi:hypothetical protein
VPVLFNAVSTRGLSLPVFPALAAFIASIVGYPVPVVCQPLTEGTAITYQVSGQLGTATISSRPFIGALLGVMQPLTVPVGDTITITVAGQTVTLPTAPTDTPSTHEQPSAIPSGWVVIPMYIALANCDGWTSDVPALRGQTLLAAIHESMHAKYADGNEALTECRAMQALPTELSSLWPDVSDPGIGPGGAPSRPSRPLRWRKLHPGSWRKALSAYRSAYASWQIVEGEWQHANDDWTSYEAVLSGADALDAGEPPQYHGATC